jgi:hypothetical protein
MKPYDYLIVGSGLFGAVFAHEAHKAGKRCLVIEKRPHTGGNIYCEEVDGINVHKYGAHIFHTDNREVWNYVNRLVEFNRYTNSPIANYKGKLYNLPFNMNTFYQLWGVGVSVELYKPVHIIPYFPVVCMKNMRTVFMHVDAVYFFAVDIATGVWTFLYHQTSLSGFMSLMGKHGSEQAAAYNQVIVWFHFPLALFLSSYKATQLLSGLQKKYRLLCRVLIKTVVSHAIGWFLSARRAKKNLFVLFSPCFVLSLRPIRT